MRSLCGSGKRIVTLSSVSTKLASHEGNLQRAWSLEDRMAARPQEGGTRNPHSSSLTSASLHFLLFSLTMDIFIYCAWPFTHLWFTNWAHCGSVFGFKEKKNLSGSAPIKHPASSNALCLGVQVGMVDQLRHCRAQRRMKMQGALFKGRKRLLLSSSVSQATCCGGAFVVCYLMSDPLRHGTHLVRQTLTGAGAHPVAQPSLHSSPGPHWDGRQQQSLMGAGAESGANTPHQGREQAGNRSWGCRETREAAPHSN